MQVAVYQIEQQAHLFVNFLIIRGAFYYINLSVFLFLELPQ